MPSSFGFNTTGDEVVSAFASQVKGRCFLITGTSAKGIGALVAAKLARGSPAQLILVARNKAKVDPVVADLKAIDSSIDVRFVTCELSDQDSVRAAAATILDDTSIPKIDVILNNAGIMCLEDYTKDKAGYEMQLSANHIGHFLLTNLLMAKVQVAAAAAAAAAAAEGTPAPHIVNVASSGHYISAFRVQDPLFGNGTGEGYDGWTAYGSSKSANMLFTAELARRLAAAGSRAQAFAVDPGYVATTGLRGHFGPGGVSMAELEAITRRNTGREFVLSARKTEAQGTSSALRAMLDPTLPNGAYVVDTQVAEPAPWATRPEDAEQLWAMSEQWVGQDFGL